MIAFILLQASLGVLPPQALPAAGCAAYLWSRSEPPQLVAMATAEPGSLRLSLDGKPVDLLRVAMGGGGARGLPADARYAAGDVAARLELTVVERPDLRDGALAPDGVLTVERLGRDAVVTPVGGMVGCAPAARGSR